MLFHELMHFLYMHFKPYSVLLYIGLDNMPVQACLVSVSCVSSILVKVSRNELGRFLCR